MKRFIGWLEKKRRQSWLWLLPIALLLISASLTFAQPNISYTLRTYTISAGGGTLTGGERGSDLMLIGSIGQVTVGPHLKANGYSLIGGVMPKLQVPESGSVHIHIYLPVITK